MKKMFRLGAAVMALGAGLMMASGVANAAKVQGIPADQMAKINSWNGVGSVVPSVLPLSDVDYKGVVTTFKSLYPDAQIVGISYDGKHNPTYEVDGIVDGLKIEMHIRENGDILNTEVKPMKQDKHMKQGKHMKQQGSMMYGQAMKGSHSMSKAFDVNDIIMPEVAETKAQEKVGGAFEAMDWSVEKDHGRLVYELDMIDGSGKEAEVKVDAMTGEVINVKAKTSKH